MTDHHGELRARRKGGECLPHDVLRQNCAKFVFIGLMLARHCDVRSHLHLHTGGWQSQSIVSSGI
jgi:hypothetical protein